MIDVQHLYAGYDHDILHDLSFSVLKGEMFGVLGPNGSGKTTLLKAINGTLPGVRGDIAIQGRPITRMTAKETAREMAVLPQHHDVSFSTTVEQTVLIGRYPYQKGLFKQWTNEDYRIAEEVMEQTGVTQFRHQSLLSLSGGERQRVFLAQALAQKPGILLLDEPTNHLDFSYQKQMLDALKQWSLKNGLTVVAIFHDLNLASLYCDRLLLLDQGKVKALQEPEIVLNEQHLSAVYRSDIHVHAHPSFSKPFTNVVPSFNEDKPKSILSPDELDVSKERVYYKSRQPLKCYSSAVLHPGFGWFEEFINVQVDHSFRCDDPAGYLMTEAERWGCQIHRTVGMMTAADVEDVSTEFMENEDFTLLVVVTAGTGNAVDVVHGSSHIQETVPGTINTWVFIDGHLSEQAYAQSLMTATEAKVRALMDMGINDPVTGTAATGTSTDSVLIAGTQQGATLEYGGTISSLGRAVGPAVYKATKEAAARYLNRKEDGI
ncbi:adenosylcobinamide amidohydrolase [Halobacillus kuroshimensis]|uniref:Adenosylcobinamide amidohydrolase n=1 Tax=Halobacillus kuroshimensis TaxID=302481 RepID=A0ABS3DU33_9BACI|nr:adenosylcobinamide amidohydrolase [Halobacillus kuroshimensis]MBN8234843.1 adenosylcobinamide amidohydrolase [Halobacillus kuroshimensis]